MSGENIRILRQEKQGENEYFFVKIYLCGFEYFCVLIKNGDGVFESLGSDLIMCEEIFEKLINNGVSPEHLQDILKDIRSDIEKEFFV